MPMAIRCSSTPVPIPISRAEKIAPRVCSLQNGSQVQPSKAAAGVRIKSYPVINKVFEDHSKGIVCYKDEKGELICEGYDEGPRIWEPSQNVHHKKNSGIPKCIPQRLKALKDTHLLLVSNDVTVEQQDRLQGTNGR